MRTRRLYRVTAVYPDGSRATRHYQTPDAANERAARFRDGYHHDDGDHESAPTAVPPAARVTVETSDPITWPDLEEQP